MRAPLRRALAVTAAVLPSVCLAAPLYVLRDGPVDEAVTFLAAVGSGHVVGTALVLGPLLGAVAVALAAVRGVTGPWWAVSAAVAAALLTAVILLLGQGAATWSGTDEQGREIGGFAVPQPGWGLIPVLAAPVLLLAAAALADRRQVEGPARVCRWAAAAGAVCLVLFMMLPHSSDAAAGDEFVPWDAIWSAARLDLTALLLLLAVAVAVGLALHGGPGLLWGLCALLVGLLTLPFTLVMWPVRIAVDPASMADVAVGPGAIAVTAAGVLLVLAGVAGMRARRTAGRAVPATLAP